ncbi:hypothetical protein CBR_g23837 [Chara braunii]|uniref:RRM domain-containing protein n=1 Tax=Chara braunii TaxID=69332 RepID=A0A388JVQ5_CHABU|nr:hypothetical protein CBR_g23837 [Chara braunii]|eukprot:GBG61886.1 hypothetical protein CBR_g23837 [Chara braunii]
MSSSFSSLFHDQGFIHHLPNPPVERQVGFCWKQVQEVDDFHENEVPSSSSVEPRSNGPGSETSSSFDKVAGSTLRRQGAAVGPIGSGSYGGATMVSQAVTSGHQEDWIQAVRDPMLGGPMLGVDLLLGGRGATTNWAAVGPPSGTSVERTGTVSAVAGLAWNHSVEIPGAKPESRILHQAQLAPSQQQQQQQQSAQQSLQQSQHQLSLSPLVNGMLPTEPLHMDGMSSFCSSFPSLFSNRLSFSDVMDMHHGRSFDMGHSHLSSSAVEEEPEEPFGLGDDLDAQNIQKFLPDDEEELLANAMDFNLNLSGNGSEEPDDYDVFPLGIELGENLNGTAGQAQDGDGSGSRIHTGPSASSSVVGEHPYGEHPSRTLFVRNINSNVEDSELRALFEAHGAIRTLYTACKHRGFVMISYYDIRAARNAMRALQNKPLRRRKLDIHFSIPKENPSDKDVNQGTLVVFNLDASVTNEELRQIFSQHGEVKEIRETPHKRHHKFIEFYDVRAAEAALRALNRSDIAGKRIKLEPSRPGGARRNLMQQLSAELAEEETLSQRGECMSVPGNFRQSACLTPKLWGAQVEVGGSRSIPYSHSPSASVGTAFSRPPHASSPVRIGSGIGPGSAHGGGQQLGQGISMTEGSQSLGGFASSRLPPHPHAQSLPEYGNSAVSGSANGSGFIRQRIAQQGSSSSSAQSAVTAAAMVAALRSRESLDGARLHPAGSGVMVGGRGDGGAFDHSSSVLGPPVGAPLLYPPGSAAAGSPSVSNPYIWGPGAFHHQNSPPMVWSHGPGHPHSFHGQGYLHSSAHGVGHPLSQHDSGPQGGHHSLHAAHVGSAPPGDASMLERRYGWSEATENLFRPGSLGSMGTGLGGVPIGLNGGTLDNGPSSPLGVMSPQHRNISSGRPSSAQSGPQAAPEGSNGSSGGGRGRRGDSASNNADNKKQYQLDIDKILRGEDPRTTLMIKNIPNKYTQKMLLAAIDDNHRGTYDFFYLPIDFKNKCNVGYAFINLISPSKIVPFYQAFNGKKWEKFNSEKVASLAYARIQGKAALVAHFQNSSLMNEDKRCRPILFHSDGPHVGDQVSVS